MAELFHGPKPAVIYTVTFNTNGASGTPPEALTVNDGTVINLPDRGSMSSTGNIFAGWNESSSGGGTTYSIGASITVKRNMVFYAQWLDGSTPQFTVTFNANGATGGAAPAQQTVYSGTSITIPGQGTLAYSGKTFNGWNTQINGGGTNYAVGAAFTVTGHITLYAKWQSVIQYTVTYHANGAGGSAPSAQTVDPGTVITLPGAGSMTNLGKTFEGWNTQTNGSGTSYEEGAAYTVNGNVTLYAKWVSDPDVPQGQNPPGNTIAEKLAYIASNAGDGTVYDIAVNNNEYMRPATISTLGRNITVIIRSASSADVKNIQLESQGHLFSVDANITLKLQNIVLKGISANNKALVMIGTGGKLVLDSGSKITMNTTVSNTEGGGIYINGGVLEMNEGCEISGNNTNQMGNGGGVYVGNRGTVTIRGGTIMSNKITNSVSNGGAGIFITGNSTVTMTGGIISKNTAWYGGGIYIWDSGSNFTKRAVSGSNESGIIYGSTGDNANIATYNGNAIFRGYGSKKNRNSTLGYYDEISSLTDEGWE
jgi:uncharacterized repeat protein (TIGR02543 family)